MRRARPAADLKPGILSEGGVTLDPRSRQVESNQQPVDLTTAEFDLLAALLASPGVILERDKLFESVLGRPYSVFDRGIDNHVSSLRKKLGSYPNGADRIKSIRGVGYLYAAPQS